MVALSDENFTARAEHLREIAESTIGELSGERCLMVGSGTGHNTVVFGRSYDEVHALDVVERDFPEIVDDAILADGTRLPYDDGVFDLTCAISVVEHVLPPANRHVLIEEMARCTKPGGHVFLQIPNGRFPLELHTGLPLIHWLPGGKELAIRKGYTTLKQVHIPSRRTLTEWVEDAGAEILVSRGFTYPSDTIPKYHALYDALKTIGVFRLFPFGNVVIAEIPEK